MRDDGPVQRAPDIDDAVAAAQQLLRLVGEMVPHARLGGGRGLIDMDPGDGRTRGAGCGAADGVVEEQDSGRAGDVLQDQLLHFRVVDVADAGVVGEGVLGGGDVGQRGEGVVVEVEVRFVPAQVLDRYGFEGFAEVALGLPGWGRLDVVEGFGAVRGRRVEGERRGYGAPRDGDAFVGCARGGVGRFGLVGGGGLKRCGGRHSGFEECAVVKLP